MGLVIGMDEAGYGPNLGPLVVSVTVWEVPGSPQRTNLWRAFESVLTNEPAAGDVRLHVGDSKQVYNPARGLRALERAVLCALEICGDRPQCWNDLLRQLTGGAVHGDEPEPWFDGSDLGLPHSADCGCWDEPATLWRKRSQKRGIRLRAVASDVVLTERFNRMTDECGKGAALSRISMQLLRRFWDPESAEPVLVLADKHGGRNRYDELIDEITDGQMIFRIEEGRDLSRYKVGNSELRFQTRSEEHLPVALASMVSKYVREIAMVLFNRYWSAHVPELRPTAGYPGDSHRFRADIAAAQAQLGIRDAVLWRTR